ncbi:DUF2301 domain-containing membrane protein [Kovacikia minuta CCNUW1]|uniref:DUF2301 domain-containing membrane protein n=1 Tax=Kovacikia minuta TaxID=2931930 RepID=UPI001CCF6F46|nr:DUF2301 domain-containing membrane protein [Kovacikia minuta]UBF23658.1 DUF2301 domain-containing membrane protein [Kovacikia minuta CCNUW1]
MTHQLIEPTIYQGQFGEFTITESDRQGVVVYRGALAVAALCFAIGVGLVLWQGNHPTVLSLLTPLYTVFCLALGVSLVTIHIYLKPLHQALQVFLAIGCAASLAIAHFSPDPFALTVYNQPLTLFGVGFTFVALTGIFFKEAFCFNRLETKFLTFLVPVLLLGHLVGWMPLQVSQLLLILWAVLFIVFAVRKLIQPIPPDIGDKSVFDYLKQQRLAKANGQ